MGCDLQDPNSEIWQHAINGVRKMREQEAAIHNEKSTIKQWEESVNNALSVVTGNVIKLLKKSGTRIDKSLVGDLKKRINGRKKRDIGVKEKNIDSCKLHYAWLKRLDAELKANQEVPTWLS